MTTIYYHKHHIIPKHAGGTDDPSNLIKLTVAEHAAAHKKLYETFGREYDRIAWLSLSNSIDTQEIHRLRSAEGGRQGSKPVEEQRKRALKQWQDPAMKAHLSQKRKEQHATLGNPMQGKKQRRVSCVCCHKEFAINIFGMHIKKMGNLSPPS